MQLLICSETGRFERPINQTRFSFTTVVLCVRRRWRSTVRFEKIHEDSYRDFGFELVSVESASVVERISLIKSALR